jgi:hypothetical protein
VRHKPLCKAQTSFEFIVILSGVFMLSAVMLGNIPGLIKEGKALGIIRTESLKLFQQQDEFYYLYRISNQGTNPTTGITDINLEIGGAYLKSNPVLCNKLKDINDLLVSEGIYNSVNIVPKDLNELTGKAC